MQPSMRFRLDPRAPEVARPHVPPPPPPGAPPAAPPAAFSPPAPAPERPARVGKRTNRRALVIGALVVVALVVAGAVAYGVTGALAYPDKYLLEEDEIPRTMMEARLTQQQRDRVGIESNPGRMSDDALDDYAARDGERPREGWAQVLGDAGGGTQRLGIFALQYSDEDAAKSAAQQLRALCSFVGGAVLRDGDIVVALAPEGTGMRNSVPVVAALIQEKSGAATVCGL